MNHSWPLAWFVVVAGGWLLITARYPDAQWSRLTLNWPTPWPQMQQGTRRAVRVAAALLGLAAVGLGMWLAPWRG